MDLNQQGKVMKKLSNHIGLQGCTIKMVLIKYEQKAILAGMRTGVSTMANI